MKKVKNSEIKKISETQLMTLIIKNHGITKLRKKYDTHYNKKIPNHVNLVYSFSGINQKMLHKHIKKSIEGIKPFKVTFNRFWKFKSNPYIYIISDDGLSRFMVLHNRLNSGILRSFKNKSMPKYIPHITLTYFDSNNKANIFFEQLKREKLDFKVNINSVQLLTQDKDYLIKSIKNFKLK
jgi:2'-5' RNA ligase